MYYICTYTYVHVYVYMKFENRPYFVSATCCKLSSCVLVCCSASGRARTMNYSCTTGFVCTLYLYAIIVYALFVRYNFVRSI